MNGVLRPQAWDYYLEEEDEDRHFILKGVREGFRITNKDTVTAGAYFANHRSAVHPDHRKEVERQIQMEIDNGRYAVVQDRPRIVSGLADIRPSQTVPFA